MWTDKVKAAAWILAIILLSLMFWQQQKGKVSEDEIAERIASKLKVEEGFVNYEKVRATVTEAITELEGKETVLLGKVNTLKNELVSLEQIKQELEAAKCAEGIEAITAQFNLCLKSNKANQSLAENRKLQIEQHKIRIGECEATLETTGEEFRRMELNFKELQENAAGHKWGIYIGAGYGISENEGLWSSGWNISIAFGYRLLGLF
jgi:chromosome segregation ATPase